MKCQSAFTFLYSEGHDIFLLQECNIPYREHYKSFQDRWAFGPSIWSGDNNSKASGVALLFKGQSFNIQKEQRVIDGRLLCVDVDWCHVILRIINVYCPPELQDRLETKIHTTASFVWEKKWSWVAILIVFWEKMTD